jgi:hypothetical protein
MKTKTEEYCYQLGYKTKKKLKNSRMRQWRDFTWEEFSALPEFQRTMRERKMTLKEIEAFGEGFIQAEID